MYCDNCAPNPQNPQGRVRKFKQREWLTEKLGHKTKLLGTEFFYWHICCSTNRHYMPSLGKVGCWWKAVIQAMVLLTWATSLKKKACKIGLLCKWHSNHEASEMGLLSEVVSWKTHGKNTCLMSRNFDANPPLQILKYVFNPHCAVEARKILTKDR